MTAPTVDAVDTLKRVIRVGLGTFHPIDPHQAAVCLSIFADRVGPGRYDGPRLTPSTHEDRLYRYLAACDVDNLVAMRRVKPDAVRAFAVWSYEPGGVHRLAAVARGDRDPGPADEPFPVPPTTMWEMLERRHTAAVGHPWGEASCRNVEAIATHPQFPRLVRAVAAAEAPARWSARARDRFASGGMWLTRADMDPAHHGKRSARPAGSSTTRALIIARQITDALALDRAAEPDAIAYGTAREFVTARESGVMPPGVL